MKIFRRKREEEQQTFSAIFRLSLLGHVMGDEYQNLLVETISISQRASNRELDTRVMSSSISPGLLQSAQTRKELQGCQPQGLALMHGVAGVRY